LVPRKTGLNDFFKKKLRPVFSYELNLGPVFSLVGSRVFPAAYSLWECLKSFKFLPLPQSMFCLTELTASLVHHQWLDNNDDNLPQKLEGALM